MVIARGSRIAQVAHAHRTPPLSRRTPPHMSFAPDGACSRLSPLVLGSYPHRQSGSPEPRALLPPPKTRLRSGRSPTHPPPATRGRRAPCVPPPGQSPAPAAPDAAAPAARPPRGGATPAPACGVGRGRVAQMFRTCTLHRCSARYRARHEPRETYELRNSTCARPLAPRPVPRPPACKL